MTTENEWMFLSEMTEAMTPESQVKLLEMEELRDLIVTLGLAVLLLDRDRETDIETIRQAMEEENEFLNHTFKPNLPEVLYEAAHKYLTEED